MDFLTSDEHNALRATVRDFCRREVDSAWRKIEETNEVPGSIFDQARKLGLFGLSIPSQYGGLGLSMVDRAGVYEELGRTHAGFTSIIGTHCGIGTSVIVQLGSSEQKARYLPRLASGEWIGAFALTEPDAGSDAASIRTRAARTANGWVLNGGKHFITNSRIASVFTVFAVTDPSLGPRGISAFIVERDTAGFSVGRTQGTMGLRGSHVAELVFTDCDVSPESLLGEAGSGYRAAMRTLAHGRIGIAARCVGAAERALELAVQHCKSRVQFGQALSEFQLTQAYIAEMATDVSAARLLTQHAAWLADQGEPARREAATAKLFASEAYGRVVDKAVQIHGGMGYCSDSPIEHYYRDARITRIYEGTSEIQKLIIARTVLEE